MTDEEIEQLIEPTLMRALEGHGFERAEVRSGEDHDGDPVLFLKLMFGSAARMLTGEQANDLLVTTHKALLDSGESRFPHMTYDFPTDQETRSRLRAQVRDLLRA